MAEGLKCYLCQKAIKGPEGAIHPAGGFGWRHLACDPQEFVQGLPVESPGDETARFYETDNGDVALSQYGALIAAREQADLARARKAAATAKGAKA